MARVMVRRSGASSLLTGLRAYYRMNEASGAMVDLVAGANLTDYAGPDAATGKLYPTARQFTRANSQYFKGSAGHALSTIVGPFTMAWWEYPYTYTGIAANYNDIAGNSVIGAYIPGWLIRHTHDGSIVLYLAHGGGVAAWSVHTNKVPPLAAWNHSIWTYDPADGAITYQLNGGAPLSYTWNEATLAAGGAPAVGATQDIRHFYNGRIGPFVIWNRVLTPDEQAQLYNAGAGLAYEDW